MRVQHRARSAETDTRRRRSSTETEYCPRRRKKRFISGPNSSDEGRSDEDNVKLRTRAKSEISSYSRLRKCESETRIRKTRGEKMEAHIQQLQDIVEHNRAEKSKMMNEKDQQNIIIDRLINTVDDLHKEMTEVADNRDALDSQVRNSLMKREDEADADKKKLQNRCQKLEAKSDLLLSVQGKLEEELSHAKTELEEMKQVNRSSKSRAKRSESERQRLMTRCQTLKESGAQAIAEKGKLEVELLAARDEIAHMRQVESVLGSDKTTREQLGDDERKKFKWLYSQAWMQ